MHHPLIGIAIVLLLGLLAQWVAWRLKLPSILILLPCGFVAGPVMGWLDPDKLMGDLLFPVVSVSVAVILFEGGLTLKRSHYHEIGRTVWRLITIGAAVTWAIAATAAHYILDLSWALAILFGAVLVVTGPTVVGPLLRQIRPVSRIARLAHWEGITIDPLGAILAVLVFEFIISGGIEEPAVAPFLGFIKLLAIGAGVGGLGAFFMVLMLRNYWIPDFLQNSFMLAAVVITFAASQQLAEESGLLAVTLMGVIVSNQRSVSVKHIIEFKEDLRVLLISALFILLAARLHLEELQALGWNSLLFMAVLFFVARPLSVFLATLGTRLDWRERLFMSWLAPRGIVAAAVASIFAIGLSEAGLEDASRLVPLTFLVIVTTATVYGLTARPLAQWLGLTQETPKGFLILGAHRWARQIGGVLKQQGFTVLMADTNRHNIATARMDGLKAYHGNVLAERDREELELDGLGALLALTANDEANSLACLHFREEFGREGVFQLPPRHESEHLKEDDKSPDPFQGRLLFGKDWSHPALSRLFDRGAVIKATSLSEQFDFEELRRHYVGQVVPLFLITGDDPPEVWTVRRPPSAEPGQTVVSLIPARD